MAIITTGGATATIKSPTLEGQFVQCVEYFQSLENDGSSNYFAASYDSDSLIFGGSFTIPLLLASNALTYSGKTEGFLTSAFSAGSGGTFTAPLALNYFLQVVQRIIQTQNDLAKNPQKTQNVTARIDMNKEQMSGSFTMPVTRALTDAGISFTAATYLL